MAFEGNVTAAIFLLKGLKPQQFRDRIEQTNLLELDPDKMTPAQLQALSELYMQKVLGTSDPALLESAFKQIEAGKTIIDIEGADVTDAAAPAKPGAPR